MKTKTKKLIIGVVLLVIGIGLCVGGVFIHPLLAPGGAVIGAGAMMIKEAIKEVETVPAQTQAPSLPTAQQLPQLDMTHIRHVHFDLDFDTKDVAVREHRKPSAPRCAPHQRQL